MSISGLFLKSQPQVRPRLVAPPNGSEFPDDLLVEASSELGAQPKLPKTDFTALFLLSGFSFG